MTIRGRGALLAAVAGLALAGPGGPALPPNRQDMPAGDAAPSPTYRSRPPGAAPPVQHETRQSRRAEARRVKKAERRRPARAKHRRGDGR